MEVANHTPYRAAANPGLLPSGRYCLILVIKATYDLPQKSHAPLQLAGEQIEPFDADAFSGEPGYSSPRYENDFATEKPRCDVILHNPTAYAPDGQPVRQVEVALRLGGIDKRFNLLGKRHWEKQGAALRPSQPEAFTEQPITWEIAYGGVDETAYDDPDLSDSYLPNPIGTGYGKRPDKKRVEGTPIAQTEAVGQPIKSPGERHSPQGLGPGGRNWQTRTDHAGTYDEDWEKNDKPFLPQDFDPRYYQCAPQDQQIDYPQGGEQVELTHLTKAGTLAFTLPALEVPVSVVLGNGDEHPLATRIDTVTIDGPARQLTLVARARYEIKNSIHEVDRFIVGEAPPEEDEDDTESSSSEQAITGEQQTADTTHT